MKQGISNARKELISALIFTVHDEKKEPWIAKMIIQEGRYGLQFRPLGTTPHTRWYSGLRIFLDLSDIHSAVVELQENFGHNARGIIECLGGLHDPLSSMPSK